MGKSYINPYNFVPFGGKVVRKAHDAHKSGETLHSGEINCTMKIKTPLAVPDSENAAGRANEHKSYPFMSVDNEPVVPGSEIRGVVRNIFETVTNSCFSVINSNTLTKRDGTPGKPGLLQWDINKKRWILYAAEKFTYYIKEKQLEKAEELALSGKIEGCDFTLREWNAFSSMKKKKGSERSYSVFVKSSDRPVEVICEDNEGNSRIIDKYNDVIGFYIFYTPSGKKQFEAVRPKTDGKLYPLFYSWSGTSFQFTPAQISRTSFDNTVKDLLDIGDARKDKPEGHSPCRTKESLCPACSLFGMVGTGGNAVASRVRFTDAKGNRDVRLYPDSFIPERCLTLRELSSPKLTSVEFYSVKKGLNRYTDPGKWTYDTAGVTLRGRKMYFHDPKAVIRPNGGNTFSTSEKTIRNSSMQLAVGGSFSFKVYYDRVTDEELKYLIWSLTLGDADGSSSLMHKLGHGKPLGLGSVKITVDERGIKERVTDGSSYEISEGKNADAYLNDISLPIKGTDTLTALKAICDFDYIKGLDSDECLSYPVGTKNSGNRNTDNNTMMWFTLNHGGIGKKESSFKYALHPLVDKEGHQVSCRSLLLEHLSQSSEPVNRTINISSSDGLQQGKWYTAVITRTYKKKDKIFVEFMAAGVKGSVPLYFLNESMQKDIGALKGKELSVKYTGTNAYGPQFFVSKNK